MKYMHTGIPLSAKLEGMMYAAPLKVWLKNEPAYQIEFLYFDAASPMAGAIQTQTHVAYEVENIDQAMEGKDVLWPKFDLGDAYIGFVMDQAVVVEFYQKK